MSEVRAEGASHSWLPAQAGRPLRHWSAIQLDSLRCALDLLYADWGADWGVPQQAAGFGCAQVGGDVVDDGAWYEWRGEVGVAAWLCRSEAFERSLAEGWTSAWRGPSPLLGHCIAAARKDLDERLQKLLGVEAVPLSSAGAAPTGNDFWSGAVHVTKPDGLGYTIVLSGETMLAWCAAHVSAEPAPPTQHLPLVALKDALANRSITVDVRLNGCELPLGALQDLRLGDVLCLRHVLDQPAQVVDKDGNLLFAAHLGRQEDRKVGELVNVS